ncbi:MAG: ribonuclease H-like domain-containing protein [Chitinophagaceae bacterium]
MDIETVPQQAGHSGLSVEWKRLWWEKISKTVPENLSPEESYLLKAGILAEFGKVICISTGYLYENKNKQICFRIKSIYGDDEKELLKEFLKLTQQFYQYKKNFLFAGHNVREFDVPYLCRRLLINQMQLPDYLYLHDAKPWEVRMLDTLQLWKFGDYKNYISLDLLANVLNIPTSKTDIDGSKVHKVYYEEKNLQRIVEYCQRDVVVVANIILRFKNLPLLEDENITIVK